MDKKKFENSLRALKKQKSKIVLQRFHLCCYSRNKKGNEEFDTIVFSRKENLTEDLLQKFRDLEKISEELDTEAELQIDVENVDNLSDEEFKKECLKAAKKCKNIVYIFFLLQKVSSLIDTICSIFAIIVASYELSVYNVIGIVMFFILSSFISNFGEWGALKEKYSRLRSYFNVLSLSTESNRVELFEKYANSYAGDGLFIDTIIFNENLN